MWTVAARFSMRVLHVSLNDAFTRPLCKCWKRNSGHLITLKIWMPCRHVWGAMHKAILKPSSKAQNNFWVKSHTREDMGQSSTRPFNKAVLSFRNSLTEYVRHWWWWKIFWAFFSTQISLHTNSVCAVLNSRDNFWMSDLLSCHDKNHHNFINSTDSAMKLFRFADNWMGNYCVKFYVISLYSSWKISKFL